MFLIHSFVLLNKYAAALRCWVLFRVLRCGDSIVLFQKSIKLGYHFRDGESMRIQQGERPVCWVEEGSGEAILLSRVIRKILFCPLILVLGEHLDLHPIRFSVLERFHSLSPQSWGWAHDVGSANQHSSPCPQNLSTKA